MFTRFAALVAMLLAFAIQDRVRAEDWLGEAGKSEFVKNLPGRDYESARNAGMPLCVYFFDPNQRNNPRGRYLEQVLSNAELRSKLKQFLYLKIRSDGSDVRGWPQNLLEPAMKSAALVFISSDFKQVIPFDKSMQTESITQEAVARALLSTLQYEKKIAAQAGDRARLNGAASVPQKDDKDAQVQKAADASRVPGLSDKDKKVQTTTSTAVRRPPTPADE